MLETEKLLLEIGSGPEERLIEIFTSNGADESLHERMG